VCVCVFVHVFYPAGDFNLNAHRPMWTHGTVETYIEVPRRKQAYKSCRMSLFGKCKHAECFLLWTGLGVGLVKVERIHSL